MERESVWMCEKGGREREGGMGSCVNKHTCGKACTYIHVKLIWMSMYILLWDCVHVYACSGIMLCTIMYLVFMHAHTLCIL